MTFQAAAYLGYQQITGLSVVTSLTLPVGPEAAVASACNLVSNMLTIGGTVSGTFAVGQVVQGTGIPPNTYIVSQAGVPESWWLSNQCSTETGETVTAYQDAGANLAVISVETAEVRYLPGGGTPSSSVGMPVASGAQLVYDAGDLAGLRFIQTATGAILDVLYYRISAPT